MLLVFALLILFQVKHFLADYPFQNAYMLGKFKGGKDWILPLAAHCGVHALFTLGICAVINYQLWWLALVDFALHFVMDRVKASPNLLGKYKTVTAAEYKDLIQIANGVTVAYMTTDEARAKLKGNTYFWHALGLDQMIHHLTDLLIVYILVS